MLSNVLVTLVLRASPAILTLTSVLALTAATVNASMVKTRSNALAPAGGKETIANQTSMIVQE
jgi:hypothetical protein